jgi:hypothetical protein
MRSLEKSCLPWLSAPPIQSSSLLSANMVVSDALPPQKITMAELSFLEQRTAQSD